MWRVELSLAFSGSFGLNLFFLDAVNFGVNSLFSTNPYIPTRLDVYN